jgi:ribosomal protein S18 acetylase RimI-like enzyme
MPVRIVPKALVGDGELGIVSQRIAAPEHAYDNGACKVWSNPNVVNYLYVAFAEVAGAQVPIGVLYADGPLHSTVPAWWLDIQYRGKGLGSQVMDAFAEVLKARGVTGLGAIPIDTFAGKYHEQSSALARRIRSHFP